MGLQESFDKMLGLVTGSNDPMLLKSVIEVQRELVGLQEENRNLRSEIHDLKNVEIIKSELKYKGNAYYKGEEGPFCTNCFDVTGKLVRLQLIRIYGNSMIEGSCTNCGAEKIQTAEINLNANAEREAKRRMMNNLTSGF